LAATSTKRLIIQGKRNISGIKISGPVSLEEIKNGEFVLVLTNVRSLAKDYKHGLCAAMREITLQ
jgi:hypothetical protein